uniref:Uncharacterized protein n=1 Tax=Arundo donax TaxID=35708 RepID=A0A0A9FHC7_ARUDO
MNSPVGALILPMIQGLETSLRAGAVPLPPQFRPAPATATATRPSSGEVAGAVRQPPQFRPAPATTTATRPLLDEVAAMLVNRRLTRRWAMAMAARFLLWQHRQPLR